MRLYSGVTLAARMIEVGEAVLERTPSRLLGCAFPAINALASIHRFVREGGTFRYPRALLGVDLIAAGVAAAGVFSTVSGVSNALLVAGAALTLSGMILSSYKKEEESLFNPVPKLSLPVPV